ncbi:Rv1476 family membrane protein [Corynebacterium sp. AOP40-9SA-29]|uniref:Rv1476 family membrane protein n=1 Tax=Corynebacterium sp. AOP40-9SA-29 TaxID=3457677 RepID=UPI004033F952
MDFENVDLQAVLDDIAETGYSTSQAGEEPPSSDLAGYQALADDGVEVVIIDTDALQSTQLRNLAQTVKDSSEDSAEDGAEASTVIVQAPNNTQVVSDVMSRYQIESNQGELHSSTGPQGVADFLNSADEAEPAFSWIYVLAIVGILLAVAATAAFARITYRR